MTIVIDKNLFKSYVMLEKTSLILQSIIVAVLTSVIRATIGSLIVRLSIDWLMLELANNNKLSIIFVV